MFVQIIKGKTNDAAGFRRMLDRWNAELKPGATGFVGSTGGIAEDGTTIGIVRFSDEAAAKENADRPEQTAWFEALSKYLAGSPTFQVFGQAFYPPEKCLAELMSVILIRGVTVIDAAAERPGP